MKTTDTIIKDCFKKASFTGDMAKYLLRILSDKINQRFRQQQKRFENEGLIDAIVNGGYSLVLGDFTIESAGNSYEYKGDKQFVVRHPYGKDRGYNTIQGAMNYVEQQ